MTSSSALLSDCVSSLPHDRLLYWLLQYCSFDGLSACRSELRALLADASERQVDASVALHLAQKGGERSALYAQYAAARDAVLASVDTEVALRVQLRQLYHCIVSCSYEHAMGLAVWLAELRAVWERAGLPLTQHCALFRVQLAAIGNIAVRAADRPRTSKSDFDQLMQRCLTYAAVTQSRRSAHTTDTARAQPRSALCLATRRASTIALLTRLLSSCCVRCCQLAMAAPCPSAMLQASAQRSSACSRQADSDTRTPLCSASVCVRLAAV